jgi:hypothetical protein
MHHGTEWEIRKGVGLGKREWKWLDGRRAVVAEIGRRRAEEDERNFVKCHNDKKMLK